MADQPTCLCIISGERIRGGDFIAALRASLRPHDQLEIIVDRRGGETQGEWERAVDRRRRPQVDAALRTNGFAMVPAPASEDDPTPPREDNPSGYGSFKCGDGFFINVGAFLPHQWKRLCEALDVPHIGEDPRYTDPLKRPEHSAVPFGSLGAERAPRFRRWRRGAAGGDPRLQARALERPRPVARRRAGRGGNRRVSSIAHGAESQEQPRAANLAGGTGPVESAGSDGRHFGPDAGSGGGRKACLGPRSCTRCRDRASRADDSRIGVAWLRPHGARAVA